MIRGSRSALDMHHVMNDCQLLQAGPSDDVVNHQYSQPPPNPPAPGNVNQMNAASFPTV